MSDYFMNKNLSENDTLVIMINTNLKFEIKRGKGDYDISIIEPENMDNLRDVIYLDDDELKRREEDEE